MAGERILIVEDEGIAALDLQHRLESLGYAAPDIVSAGEAAVAAAERTRPDLVLMDIMLQGAMDGVMAAEQIHARLGIPIIYLTAYADENSLRRAKVTEPYGYLIKPFRERDLQISIEMAFYKHNMVRKLKESEKWLATTLNSIGDAVIATDREGLIRFLNTVAEQLTGWKRKDAARQKVTSVFRIVNMGTRKPVEDSVAKVLREGAGVNLADHRILLAKDGREVPIEDSAAPIKDDKGDIIGAVLVFRDVTERLRAEEVLHSHAEELRSSNEELRFSNEELERLNRTMVDRELRMIELKKQVNELCGRLGQPPRYPLDFEEEPRPGRP